MLTEDLLFSACPIIFRWFEVLGEQTCPHFVREENLCMFMHIYAICIHIFLICLHEQYSKSPISPFSV